MASSSISLTDNAVPIMVKSEVFSGPLIVGITHVQLRKRESIESKASSHQLNYHECKVFDGCHYTTSLIALRNDHHWILEHTSALKISVQGYTSSTANYGAAHQPFLCIDTFSIVENHPKRKAVGRNFQLKQDKVQGGKATSFLADVAPFLSSADLAGSSGILNQTLNHDTVKSINIFLVHHSAMLTLHSTSLASEPSAAMPTNYYMSALAEFSASQLDRQVASLRSNAGREDANRSNQVTEQYMTALNMALEHAKTCEDLTMIVLQQWHAALCGKGLHPEAGSLRTNNVHAGTTLFAPKERIVSYLEKLLRALKLLENNLIKNKTEGLGVVTFAAAAFYGTIDIHPFADGNGRLSRIVANWALRRGGLPFVFNFFATQTQRVDYVSAIINTRRNTHLKSHGTVEEESLLNAFRNAGALLPLVDLILDRVSKAAVELEKIVTEKSNLAADLAEAKAARKYRERAAAGTCIICFDDKPNIATLCCGKAVHLNCIAEWLSSQNSCPTCRTELPILPRRVAQNENEEEADASDDTSSDESEETTTDDMEDVEEGASSTGIDYTTEDDATLVDTTGDDDTPEVVAPAVMPEVEESYSTTEDDDTTVVVEPAVAPDETTAADDTTSDGGPDSESTGPEAVVQYPLFCEHGHCRNRAALDCINRSCGRCCVLHGHYQCNRHNG
jgi:fido (protein-threonine AMPylation protein)